MAGFHCVQSAMHAGSRPRCLLHLQHRRIMIYWYICHTDCHGKKNLITQMYSGLKGCREAKNTQPKPHFYQAAPPTCAPPHPAGVRSQKKAPRNNNNNKTAATAGVGRVQLNFQTAGRDQRWKSIFCSNTRPASIIQRRVPLGELTLSPSPALLHADSLADSLALLRGSWRFQDFKKKFHLFFF